MKDYRTRDLEILLGRKSRTIRDWIQTGCPTPGGPVRLEAVKIGRWWSVSEEALVLFRHRCAQASAAARPRLDDEAGTTAPSETGKGESV